MMRSGAGDSADRFSLVAGGPFHALLRRLGLIGERQVPTLRAAIGLALFAWALPALLVVAQSILDGNFSGWGYFTDLTVYSRYLVAVGVLIATERHADGRLNMLVRQFRKARLLTDASLPGFNAAVAATDRLSASAAAEAILVASALVWSGISTRVTVELAGTSWEGTVGAGGVEPSWAGVAGRFVSNPLFLFLVIRWFWRFLLWSALLSRVSRLELQLTPLHPDRAAGLGFLAIYPSIFGGLVFSLSCVVASSMLKDLDLQQHSPQTVWFALAGWLGICLVWFLGPLVVFARPLYWSRERALLDYGRLANEHHLAFARKWIKEERDGEELLGCEDVSSAADLNASVEAIREMRVVPVDGASAVRLLVAAGVPMLAVAATQVPLTELLKWIAGALF